MSEESGKGTGGTDFQELTKPRWGIPHRLDYMTFVGRDVLAVGHDVYIFFINLKTYSEAVYVANDVTKGDGIDCIAGHRSSVFAFAEKRQHPGIFVCTYPAFVCLAELKDPGVNRYKNICMTEGDLIIGFSGFPNYTISVWSWRICQKLISVPTNVVRRGQIYMASRTHPLVCESWGEGLIVWEVAQCYRHCLLMKRNKNGPTCAAADGGAGGGGGDDEDAKVQDACWTAEGHLYVIDAHANLYSVNSDGIGMVTKLEWSENLSGGRTPHVCSFGHGLIIYCPDGQLRALRVVEAQWQVVWTHEPIAAVSRLVSNSTSDVAVVWTEKGHVYRVTGEAEDKLELCLLAYKQRNIVKMQLVAPACEYLVTINNLAELCTYEVATGKLVETLKIKGQNVRMQASPVDPVLAVYGEVGFNYGICLFSSEPKLKKMSDFCLTHQIVSRVCFSPRGKELVAAAMAAGHIFVMKVKEDFQLETVRYVEIGRGLADCFMTQVGPAMRCFSLVLFSDKYRIGERIVCINAETGKDNKFAGKMQGPYAKLMPLATKDTILAIPHLTKQFHILKLAGEKGVTVSVKVHKIVDSGHEVKMYYGIFNNAGVLTYGIDGMAILRQPDGSDEYDLKLVASHRYETGLKYACVDLERRYVATLAGNRTLVVQYLDTGLPGLQEDVHHEPIDEALWTGTKRVKIIREEDKNWLDLQEERKVKEEAMDYRKQREDVVKTFEEIQKKLVALLEENMAERPLHQLPVSEFNLHMEAKRERLKQAAEEREVIRQQIEATIVAQDKVTAWIKQYCWDAMLTPRVKLCAIFSHYVVENYAVLPTQRENWPELQLVEFLRGIEMENDANLFRPWEERKLAVKASVVDLAIKETDHSTKSIESQLGAGDSVSAEEIPESEQHVLSGTLAHRFISVPTFVIPQMLAFSFLQMHWLQDITKLKSQNMRLWFNKEFDELMNVKKREVGLVEERNRRLRVIISELNKLSDLRGSFHHLMNTVHDPEWKQEEQPWKLIKVDPEELSIEPYISPSQVVVIPPDPGPKDDFKERALIDMMDGVLEKLWHEEIKKPIPVPACMLEKDPEYFNEDDLRAIFDYEAKVEFRNEERDKYRKMLHAEFAKLTVVLNEGVVKFNMRVKDMFITKLKVESVIGQENLNLMRLRRVNLDRTEAAEAIEQMRNQIGKYESEIESLQKELKLIQEQASECQSAYEALALKDRLMDRNFKANFADLSPIVVDQCYRMFKRRPKWVQRASMIPVVLYEMASACVTGHRSVFLHPDCYDYLRGVDQLDSLGNMPPVMDEALWSAMCKLRRAKVDVEIRMRAMCLESALVEQTSGVWGKAISARRLALARTCHLIRQHREQVEFDARNKTIQLVLPAGLVEIATTGRASDFTDATLIRREDVEAINDLIMRVGQRKLAMMRKHMEFRRGILAKEWEHAQMAMRLRHMEEELYSYERLKIPKELQRYLKTKEQGYTDERDYAVMERESEAAKRAVNKLLYEQIQRTESIQVKISTINARMAILDENITKLKLKLSEKRLTTDPMEPIRRNQALKKRMDTLVQRSRLIREVQDNHTTIVLLQTQLELLRLKTFPTLSTFRTIC